jgi:hypothetical protein
MCSFTFSPSRKIIVPYAGAHYQPQSDTCLCAVTPPISLDSTARHHATSFHMSEEGIQALRREDDGPQSIPERVISCWPAFSI